MKKIYSLLLVFALIFTLSACGAMDEPEQNASIPNQEDQLDQQATNDTLVDGQWPNNSWTEQVNKPSTGTIGAVKIGGESGEVLSIKMDWTREDAIAYAEDNKTYRYFGSQVTTNYDDPKADWLFIGVNGIGFNLAVSATEILVVRPL